MTVKDLPLLNAILNSLSTMFLLAGWWFITHQQIRKHIACMVSALVTSTAFLTSYLIYHYHVGHVRFTAEGPVRGIYYSILFSHLVLAIVLVPLIILTLIPALRSRFHKHQQIARWTLPIWLYVSVTGVVIYVMLYHWFRSTAITPL